MTHVPYRGGAPALTDLIAGQIQFMFPTMLAAAPHVRGSRLRSLGVSSAGRALLLPDIPTIAEAGVPGFEAASWNGLMTPAGVAPALIARINCDAVRVLQSPEVRDKLAADGAEAVGNTPQAFTAHIRGELEKWGRVIKAAGLDAS
jgi:tripartite-type tricarboxylate transporter receptor subunit TctC